jgi:hypothetical protein
MTNRILASMSQADPLYVHERYSDPRVAHEKLIEQISHIKTEIETGSDRKFSVAWATENHDHGSEYEVVDVNERTPDDTLQVVGASRGGKYDIVPHHSEPPQIRYHHPNFEDVKWIEEADELIIMAGTLAYDKEKGYLDWLKEQLSL